MQTLDSENISSDNSSTDHILTQILKIRNKDGCIKKSLYQFNSVEHSFNVKLVKKSPHNNNSGPSFAEDSLTGNSNTPTKASQETNAPIPAAVVEIMLPVKVPFKSAVSKGLEELPRSNKEETPFTPIQLFKYSRFNLSKLHNFSTPKGSSKTSLFTCPFSPIGKDLEKLNMRDKSKIIAQPAKTSHIKEDKHESNQNIPHDNSGYCCFHKTTRRSSNQKTITKSKYMSLGSVKNTKMSPLAFNSKTVEETMGMSLSNMARESYNADISDDTSSSSGSAEIPNINVETSFYLSRMLIDSNKEIVQRPHVGPSRIRGVSREDLSGFNEVDLDLNESENNQQYGITVTDNLRNLIQPPVNDNMTEAALSNAPIAQYDVIATEEIGDILQPPVNNNIQHDLLTEESDSMSGFSNMDESTNELDREANLQNGSNLAKLIEATLTKAPIAQNDINATEKMENIIEPPINNNVQLNLIPEESDYSGESIVIPGKTVNADTRSPMLTSLTDLGIIQYASEVPVNHEQLKSTVDFTVGVRQSARLKKIDGSKRSSSTLIKAKLKSSKAIVKNDSVPIDQINKNKIKQNSPLLPNKPHADAPIDEQLPFMLDISHRSSRSLKSNQKPGSGQPKSTVDCTVEVRQSARLKKIAGCKLNSSISEAKRKSSKAVVTSNSKPILKTSSNRCRTQRNSPSRQNKPKSTIVKSDSEPIDEILNKICTAQPNSPLRLNKSFADATFDEQLPCLTDSYISSRSRKPKHKSRSEQLKSTMKCTVEVRQSARLKKLTASPNSAISKAKRRSSKPVAKKSSEPVVKILKKSCRVQRNAPSRLNKSFADATTDAHLRMADARSPSRSPKPMHACRPNHKSGPRQPKSTVDCIVEVGHSPRLKTMAGNKPSSILTKVKLKSSKEIVKSDSEPIDQILNKIYTSQPNSSPRQNKSFADPTSDEQLFCKTAPRRSSRSPKPIHAYWVCGLRPIIPVIRDITQLADHYDSKIPIILLPPKQLSNKAMSNLLNQINDRMIFRPAYGKSMRF